MVRLTFIPRGQTVELCAVTSPPPGPVHLRLRDLLEWQQFLEYHLGFPAWFAVAGEGV